MPAAGYVDYARAMLALPADSPKLMAALNMPNAGAMQVMRALWSLGLVHPGEKREIGIKRHPVAIWLAGKGPRADGIRVGLPKRPNLNQIAFATVWRALEDGATCPEILRDSGISRVSLIRIMRALRPLIRICAWERTTYDRPIAVWGLGAGPDMRKPKPRTNTENKRTANARKTRRLLDGTRMHERYITNQATA